VRAVRGGGGVRLSWGGDVALPPLLRCGLVLVLVLVLLVLVLLVLLLLMPRLLVLTPLPSPCSYEVKSFNASPTKRGRRVAMPPGSWEPSTLLRFLSLLGIGIAGRSTAVVAGESRGGRIGRKQRRELADVLIPTAELRCAAAARALLLLVLAWMKSCC